jgi:pyruvate formate lyase activating enzyme
MTAIDGIGMRAMIFLHGCPLRCLFCANVDTSRGPPCMPKTDSESIKQNISRLKSYVEGVTVSGGELLMQPNFASSILNDSHDLGLNTCIDTSGFGTRSSWNKVLSATDMALFCVKSFDPDVYYQLTGQKNTKSLQFADELANRNIPYYLRYVVIPGYTDRPNDIEKLIEFSKKQPTLRAIELLPYHNLGVHKWAALGLKYQIEGTNPPSTDEIDKITNMIKTSGLKVLV